MESEPKPKPLGGRFNSRKRSQYEYLKVNVATQVNLVFNQMRRVEIANERDSVFARIQTTVLAT